MIMVDANIFMDVTGQREGAAQSGLIINMVKEGKIDGAVSAMTIPILWFMESRKNYMLYTAAKETTRELTKGFKVLPMTAAVIEMAYDSKQQDDFEDAIQFHSAVASKCEAIITRNKRDFPASSGIKILTPEEFLSKLQKD